MKNSNIVLLTLVVCISTQIIGMEAPPAKPTTYFELLPHELQLEASLYALLNNDIPNIPALAQVIRTKGRDAISVQKLIDIFESLPTYAAALYLAENLQDLPILKDSKVIAWINAAKSQLINGQPLFDAVAKGNLDTIKNLTANKYSNLNWRSTQTARGGGLVPLLRAVSLSLNARTEEKVVYLLLKAGANPNLTSLIKDRQGNNENWTALIPVSSKGHAQTVILLLQAGADPNHQDISGDTALIEAARSGHADVVSLLLEAGANPSLANKDGKTTHTVAKTSEIRQLLEAAAAKRK